MKKIYFIFFVLMMSASVFAQAPQKMSYQAIVRNASNNLVTTHSVGMRISILQGSASGTAVYTETQTPTTNANGLVSIEIGGGTIVSGSFTGIDWAAGPYFIKTETDPTGSTSYTITGTSQLLSVPYAMYAGKAGNGFSGNYSDLTNKPVLATVATSGSYTDLSSKPSLFDGSWTSLTGKPTFATVATTGSYNDLNNKPTLFDGTWTSLTGKPTFAAVATTGSYNDLTNKPNLKDTITKFGFNGNYKNLTNLPSLWDSTYNTIKNKPNLSIYATKDMSNQNITNLANPINAQDAATKSYVDALKQQIKLLEDNLISNGLYKLQDIDGNQYKVIKIGTQVWMAENLKTTKYRNGDLIGTTSPSNLNISSETTPKYQWAYGGNEANATTYGRLYTWYAVTENRGVCPESWHVPTDAEWTTLENYLIANGYNFDGTTTENKLGKALASATGWAGDGTAGAVGNTDYPAKQNASGFSALPGGRREETGASIYITGDGVWWASSELDANNGGARLIMYIAFRMFDSGYNKKRGLSVRCLKD